MQDFGRGGGNLLGRHARGGHGGLALVPVIKSLHRGPKRGGGGGGGASRRPIAVVCLLYLAAIYDLATLFE